ASRAPVNAPPQRGSVHDPPDGTVSSAAEGDGTAGFAQDSGRSFGQPIGHRLSFARELKNSAFVRELCASPTFRALFHGPMVWLMMLAAANALWCICS